VADDYINNIDTGTAFGGGFETARDDVSTVDGCSGRNIVKSLYIYILINTQ